MKITCTYAQQSNRLLIEAPFMLNEYVRRLPSRRWITSIRRWGVPLVMVNVRALDDMANAGLAIEYDEAAKAAVARLRDVTRDAARVTPFPWGDYQFPADVVPMRAQHTALDMAWGKSSFGLFMEMGTGKTFVAITLACARYATAEIDRLVVLAPMSVRRNWIGGDVNEFTKYATVPWQGLMLDSSKPHQLNDFITKGPHMNALRVLLVATEGLGISDRQRVMVRRFVDDNENGGCMIVCDESVKIKNPGALRTAAAIELAGQCQYRLIMNGTPIANGIEDLYSQVQFMDPNIIGVGDYYSFRNRYCELGGFENRQIVGYRHMEELMGILAPWTYQVRKRDALDLPPKIPVVRWVKPSKDQKTLLDAIRRQPLQPDPQTGQIPTKNVLERMLRLQQVIGGFCARVDEGGTKTATQPVEHRMTPKMEELLNLLDDVPRDAKVVIWARYRPEIEAIRLALGVKYGLLSVVEYHGGVDEASRAARRASFQTDPVTRFFVGNQSTGGLGIELFAASYEVYYSNTFSFVERVQSEDRVHRKGLVNPVTIIDLLMEGTLDELIIEALSQKKNIDEYVCEQLAARRGQATKYIQGE